MKESDVSNEDSESMVGDGEDKSDDDDEIVNEVRKGRDCRGGVVGQYGVVCLNCSHSRSVRGRRGQIKRGATIGRPVQYIPAYPSGRCSIHSSRWANFTVPDYPAEFF